MIDAKAHYCHRDGPDISLVAIMNAGSQLKKRGVRYRLKRGAVPQ